MVLRHKTMKSLVNFSLLLTVVLLLPKVSTAQLSEKTIHSFKADIISRINYVSSKVKLSPQRQIEIGNYFKRQDSLANIAISRGVSPDEVDKFYGNDPQSLKHVLTPFELIDYSVSNDKSGSKFAVAIKYRKQLTLDQRQIDTLLNEFSKVNNFRANKEFDIKKYEGKRLVAILNKDQLNGLLRNINKGTATITANDEWKQLQKLNLVQELDSAKAIDIFYEYEIAKSIQSEYMKNIGLDYNNRLPVSEFSNVIKYRKEINLTTVQIDSLLDKVTKLESFRQSFASQNLEGKYYAKPFESEQILKILTANQFENYLTNKNLNKSLNNSKNTWAKLKEMNLIAGVDTTNIKNDIQQYELKILVAGESYTFSKTQEDLFKRKDIENNKPEILKKMDIANKTAISNTKIKQSLAW
jgi:hypothetical protein